jgi:sugar phosphate isomerase/epimerase
MFASLNTNMIGHPMPPAEAIALAARHGFDGVDLNADALEQPEATRDLLDEAGLRPGRVMGLLPGKTDADDAAWDAALDRLDDLAARAATAGLRRTTLVVLPFHPTLPADANEQRLVQRLKQAAPILADHGVAVGLEYVSQPTRRAGQPNPFVHDLAGLLPIVERVDHPAVGLLIDSFHWHCAGETAADLRRLPASRVVVVHVADAPAGVPMDTLVANRRALPGATGDVDHAGFFDALRGIGYGGPVTAEPFDPALGELGADEAADRTAAALRRVMGDREPGSRAGGVTREAASGLGG